MVDESGPAVEIIIVADDVKATLIGGAKEWMLHIEDSGEDAPNFVRGEGTSWVDLPVTTAQAAAIMALFIGIGEESDVNSRLGLVAEEFYRIAEPVFAGVHRNLRIIP